MGALQQEGYMDFLQEIKQRIREAQYAALKSVNKELITPKIQERSLDYSLVYTDEYLSKFTLETRINHAQIKKFVGLIDADRFTSVWYRRPLVASAENSNPLYKAYIGDEIEGFTSYFFNSLSNAVWVSSPAKIELARNKILQLTYAKEMGLSVPDTLITSDIKSFNEFYARNSKKVIVKSIKGHWYDNMGGNDYLFFTSLLEEDKLPTKESLSISPCLFQEYCDKKLELRSTVVGNKVFTAAIYSQEMESSRIDWRLGAGEVRHEKFELPEQVEVVLLSMNKKFGLNFGAYDLILKPDGTYVFLELNPNGQWGWIEKKTGLPIREALVDFLQYGTN